MAMEERGGEGRGEKRGGERREGGERRREKHTHSHICSLHSEGSDHVHADLNFNMFFLEQVDKREKLVLQDTRRHMRSLHCKPQ